MLPEPSDPAPSDLGRKHQPIPKSEKLVDLDVEPDIVVGPLPENLLVDARPIDRVVQVIGERGAAPTNVMGQLDLARGLDQVSVIDVVRNGDRPRRRSKLRGPCTCHCQNSRGVPPVASAISPNVQLQQRLTSVSDPFQVGWPLQSQSVLSSSRRADRLGRTGEGRLDHRPDSVVVRRHQVGPEWAALRAASIRSATVDDRERRQNDTWIAACAMSIDPPIPVLTGNLRDFSTLPDVASDLTVVHPDL